jgi:hypothetical protein
MKVLAAVVLHARGTGSAREEATLRTDGCQVVPQIGFDRRAVVTAAATRQQHSYERQSPRNRQESRHLTASDASLTRGRAAIRTPGR